MAEMTGNWDVDQVVRWLESQFEASFRERDHAKAHGHNRLDDVDRAAAKEWVCRMLKSSDATKHQDDFVDRIEALIEQNNYRYVGFADAERFRREVRSFLCKVLGMARTNSGFHNTAHFQ